MEHKEEHKEPEEHPMKKWVEQQEEAYEILKEKSGRLLSFHPFHDLLAIKTAINCKGEECIKNKDDEGAEHCQKSLQRIDEKLKKKDSKKWEQYKIVEGNKYDKVKKHKKKKTN